MRLRGLFPAILAGYIGLAGLAASDQAFLEDGSVLVGAVRGLSEGALRFETSFGGELSIPWAQVRGVATDGVIVAEGSDGSRLTGRLVVTDGAPGVLDASGATSSLSLRDLTAIWPEGEAPERELAPEPAATVVEVKPRAAWTGRAELGLNGQSGNKERIDVRGGVNLNRATETTRLNLYLRGQYAETNNDRSANEVMGGGRIEWDFSERTYMFAKIDLEQDEFEDLELRTTITTGLGHFFIKREKIELKGWAGAGYEREIFEKPERQPLPAVSSLEEAIEVAVRREVARRLSGGDPDRTMSEAVVELGYNYRHDFGANFRFIHGLTYYPSLNDPTGDYRINADTSLEFPLGKDPDWTLRTGVRNEYDAMPQAGVERLDTTYFLNLGYKW